MEDEDGFLWYSERKRNFTHSQHGNITRFK